ncbi:septum formation protein Maf [Candidatus Peribacteria bacterium RIFOXYC1_FULL_54_13]|nr:MAG: septum formation protein Maf [Candidatus Peribacteria bacterium RIFOXYA1_FULL_56_14]OGJ73696.1 MAG: septum formation protein Maf [Candidatus Peribacteria bacterium RIFOXYA2_FULL_55_28]OGJ75279.1 MAG: septum formation protein Maf [Candidatus Peribacteria bacterium RIFOXYB1_FULL_54_35]OGJ76546.1 MAG: septum formation protein Maf [Candidatus Peribacteria bacterium RIFOXYB2_FULL_54_17]OGJ77743.1 MAG: septum formation protein Maf [Candidatus Peribacteria bacterium RIFOXYC1_FULL_54_13]OGJ830
MSTLFVLASASPQRRLLLQGLGLDFIVCASEKAESVCMEADPAERAKILARLKADDVSTQYPDAWVLGGDTLVVSSRGELLEKPLNADDARRMLRLHSGSVSAVHSTLCLRSPAGEFYEGLSTSKVYFRELSDEDIAWWIGTELWRDRSGAFQIDGQGQLLISHMEGDWSGVVGLPVFLFGELCRRAGLVLLPK